MIKFKKLVSLGLAVIMTLSLGTTAFAQEMDNNNVDYAMVNSKRAEQYLIVEGEYVYFNYEQAEKQGESQDVIDQGLLIETISTLYNNDEFTISTMRKISFPVWGNYCGPGHSGNGFKDKPTDILDKGCKQHDLCFLGIGYKKNCKCNQALVKYIDNNYKKMSGFKMKSTALAIKTYFSTAGKLGC